jgi:DNA-binding response OmpR family regulator
VWGLAGASDVAFYEGGMARRSGTPIGRSSSDHRGDPENEHRDVPQRPHLDLLVIEDHEPLRTGFVEILREEGYKVAEAANATSALDLFNSMDVGAILLDVSLPGLSGLWFLDQLDDPPPVVLITGQDYDLDIMTRRPKVLMYIQKPLNPPELLDVAARALAVSHNLDRSPH